MMRAGELRDMTDQELQQQLYEYKEELFNLRFQKTVDELDNPLRIREIRRDIARVYTVIRERERSSA